MTGKIAVVIGRCGTWAGTLVHQDNEKVVLRNARKVCAIPDPKGVTNQIVNSVTIFNFAKVAIIPTPPESSPEEQKIK